MSYDVIVVGGRVSGSISSLYASKNGMRVLMIEKNQEIGTPVQCAGGVSKSFFETIEMKPSSDLICSEIQGAKLYAPNRVHFSIKHERLEGYILERKMLDKLLAIKSAEAGTEIMIKSAVKDLIINKGVVEGVVVRHNGRLMEITSPIVIGADGVESQVGRMAKLHQGYEPMQLGSCAQYEMVGLELDNSLMEFYFGSKIAPNGYIWIFPKGDNRANVGLGVRSTDKPAIYYLEKFISSFNATKIELNVGAVPISGPLNKTYSDGLLLVGDAAGHVDPLTGGGIHLSAICSKIAGEIAAEAIAKDDVSSDFLIKYEKEWKNKIGPHLEKELKFRKIFDNLSDEDLNKIIDFFKKNDFESLSTLSLLKLGQAHPQLLRLLKNILW